MFRGTLSARRLSVLVRRLPLGARLWAALGSDEAWTAGEHLLASIFDRVGAVVDPDVKPAPRPGDLARARAAQAQRAARRAAHERRAAERQREEGG